MFKNTANAQVLKGLLDILVLSVVKQGDNYGFGILQSISDQLGTNTVLRDATLYPLLHRLESKDLIESYFRPGDRGTARKYYCITSEGRKYLKERIIEWHHVAEVLQKIVLPKEES